MPDTGSGNQAIVRGRPVETAPETVQEADNGDKIPRFVGWAELAKPNKQEVMSLRMLGFVPQPNLLILQTGCTAERRNP